MTSTLLDYARLDSKKLTPEIQPLDLHGLLHNTINKSQKPAEEKQLNLTLFLNDNLPSTVYGDKNILERIIKQLLYNAIKFTNIGGAFFTAEALRTENQTAFIRFAVSDTGIGFDSQFKRRIFELFELADQPATRAQQGTGLGLAL